MPILLCDSNACDCSARQLHKNGAARDEFAVEREIFRREIITDIVVVLLPSPLVSQSTMGSLVEGNTIKCKWSLVLGVVMVKGHRAMGNHRDKTDDFQKWMRWCADNSNCLWTNVASERDEIDGCCRWISPSLWMTEWMLIDWQIPSKQSSVLNLMKFLCDWIKWSVDCVLGTIRYLVDIQVKHFH